MMYHCLYYLLVTRNMLQLKHLMVYCNILLNMIWILSTLQYYLFYTHSFVELRLWFSRVRWTCSLKLSKRKIWNKIHMKRKSISFIGKFIRYRDIDEHNMFRQTCESTFSEHMKMRFLEWLKCRQWAALHFQMLKQFQCTCKHQWVESNLSGANL